MKASTIRRASVSAVLVYVWLAASGCSETDTSEAEARGQAGAVGPCAADEAFCSGYCVRVLEDRRNCGRCDLACSTGTECVNGQCVSSGGAGGQGTGGTSGASGGFGGSSASGGVSNRLTSVETPGADCTIPEMPTQLTDNPKFPDPFTMMDNTPVTTRDQWVCRHREISAMIQQFETGTKPPKPAEVTGSFADGSLTVTVSDGAGKTGSFQVSIEYPSTGTAPYPALIGLTSMAVGSLDNNHLKQMGVAIISYNHNNSIRFEGDRNSGLFTQFTGESSAGSLIAWAWGVSRLIDALQVTPDANINPERLAVTGCSRDGKGALMIGAMDSRIALTIPQESGSGGVAAWRASEYENRERMQGGEVQTLATTVGETHWFGTVLDTFSSQNNGSPNRLPVDHHELIALAAPRALLALGNIDRQWLGRYNGVQSLGAARMVYEALGVRDHLGFVESNHQDCSTDYGGREQQAIDAFVQRFLLDQDVSTDFYDDAMTLEEDRWIDWSTPDLT